LKKYLNKDWQKILDSELNSENFFNIEKFLKQEEEILKNYFSTKRENF
jgi:uracil DNA glycosylase